MRGSRPLTIAALLLAGAVATAAFATVAGSATKVRVGKLVLRADARFQPRELPRRHRVPIRFEGYADIKTTDGSPPPALRRLRVDFDRDGLLTTAGLATCNPARLAGAGARQARNRCGAAQVGAGRVGVTVGLPGRPRVNLHTPLSLFNGPRQGGDATVIAHAQVSYPTPETHVVTIPVERRRGSYRATFDLPAIAGGHGALTNVNGRVGRRYRAGGAERSYVSARCSDGIFETHGLAWFADGTVISGNIFTSCDYRR